MTNNEGKVLSRRCARLAAACLAARTRFAGGNGSGHFSTSEAFGLTFRFFGMQGREGYYWDREDAAVETEVGVPTAVWHNLHWGGAQVFSGANHQE